MPGVVVPVQLKQFLAKHEVRRSSILGLNHCVTQRQLYEDFVRTSSCPVTQGDSHSELAVLFDTEGHNIFVLLQLQQLVDICRSTMDSIWQTELPRNPYTVLSHMVNFRGPGFLMPLGSILVSHSTFRLQQSD